MAAEVFQYCVVLRTGALTHMNTIHHYSSGRFLSVGRVAPPTIPWDFISADLARQEFSSRLTALYTSTQHSSHVFGSPLGPVRLHGSSRNIPRFVYFGSQAHVETPRLAFYAGFDAHDLGDGLALLALVERLARSPDLGRGLNLSFFPLVDVAGYGAELTPGFGAPVARALREANWRHSREPEIVILQKDTRTRGYHGFVRLETSRGVDDAISIELRGNPVDIAVAALGAELVASTEPDPYPVRWEGNTVRGGAPVSGPLALGDDLPFGAFESIVRIPAAWSLEYRREAAGSILGRFVERFRAHHAARNHT